MRNTIVLVNKLVQFLIIVFLINISFIKQGKTQQLFYNNKNDGYYLVRQGNGVYLNSFNQNIEKKINSTKWVQQIDVNQQGWLFGRAFNGISYAGLQIVKPGGVSKLVDLIKTGLPSNYFEKISSSHDTVVILVNNLIFMAHNPYNVFKEINISNIEKIRDVYLANNEVIILFKKKLTIFNVINQTIKSYDLKASQSNIKIVGKLNGDIILNSGDSIHTINLITNNQNSYYLPNNYNVVFNNKVFYFPSNNGLSFFDGNSVGKMVDIRATSVLFNKHSMYCCKNGKLVRVKKNTSDSTIILEVEKSFINFPWYESKQINKKIKGRYYSIIDKYGNWSKYFTKGQIIKLKEDLKIGVVKVLQLGHEPMIIRGDVFEPTIIIKYTLPILTFIILLILFSNLFPLYNNDYLWLPLFSLLLLVLLYVIQIIYLKVNNIDTLVVVWVISFCIFILLLQRQFFNRVREAYILTEFKRFSHGGSGMRNIQRIIRMGNNMNSYNTDFERLYLDSIKQYIDETEHQIKIMLKIFPVGIQNIRNIFYLKVLLSQVGLLTRSYFYFPNPKKQKLVAKKLVRVNEILIYLKKNLYQNYKVNPVEIINKVMQSYQKDFEFNDISTKIILQNFKELFVLCREEEFVKILEILIENSIEALERKDDNEDKWIQITVTDEILRCSIKISDNGIGVPLKIVNTVFQPATTTKPGGGFGLFYVKKQAEKFLGQINLEDTQKNTTFNLKLRVIK